jgi:hypothetical protein
MPLCRAGLTLQQSAASRKWLSFLSLDSSDCRGFAVGGKRGGLSGFQGGNEFGLNLAQIYIRRAGQGCELWVELSEVRRVWIVYKRKDSKPVVPVVR